MKDLLVVLPSRRPHNVARLWDSFQQTCQGDTTLLIGIDDDDPHAADYPAGPEYLVRPWPGSIVKWINLLAAERADDFRFTGHIGDDVLPRTPGWDLRMTAALEETPFAHANDLYPFRPPGSLACHVFCRSEVIRALGYFGPPAFRSMYVDDVWTAWGYACGISFLDDVILEHLHWTAGKAPSDEYYTRSAGHMEEGQMAFTAYCMQGGLSADIRKIQAVTACAS